MTDEKINKIYELFSIAYIGYKEGIKNSDNHLYHVLTTYPEISNLLSKEEATDSLKLIINMNNKIMDGLESKIKKQDASLNEDWKIMCDQNEMINGLSAKLMETIN